MVDTPKIIGISKNILAQRFVNPDGTLTPEAARFLQSLHTPINGYTKTVPQLANESFDEAALETYLADNGYKDHSQLSHLTADDHPQYWNDERGQDGVANVIKNGTGLTWTYVDGPATLTGNVSLSPFNTGNLAEGSNLYWTQARFDAANANNVRFLPHTVTPWNTTDDAVVTLLSVAIAAVTVYLRTGKIVIIGAQTITIAANKNAYVWISDDGTLTTEQVAFGNFKTDWFGSKTLFLWMQSDGTSIVAMRLQLAGSANPRGGHGLPRRDQDNDSDYWSVNSVITPYNALGKYSLNNGVNVYFLGTALVFDGYYNLTRARNCVECLLNFILISEPDVNAVYQVGQHVRGVTGGNAWIYRVTTAGTTGAGAFTWGGATVTHGTVTFMRMFTLAVSPNTPLWFFPDINSDIDTTATIRAWDSNDSYASVLLEGLETMRLVMGAAAYEAWWQSNSIVPDGLGAGGVLTYEQAIYQLDYYNIIFNVANGLSYTFQNQRAPLDVSNNSQYTYDAYETISGQRSLNNIYNVMTTTSIVGKTLTDMQNDTLALRDYIAAGIGGLYDVTAKCMKWEYNTPVRADADWVFYPDVNVQIGLAAFNIPLDPIYARNCWNKYRRFVRTDANGGTYYPFAEWFKDPKDQDFAPYLLAAQCVKNSRMRELGGECMRAFKAMSGDPRNGVNLIQDDAAQQYLSRQITVQ